MEKKKLNRRELLIATAGTILGGVVTGLAVDRLYEQADPLSPLRPENGDSESSLTIEWLPPTVKRWGPLIEKHSSDYDIDPNIVAIIMTIESGGDPLADSGVATGLMQFTDDRARDTAAKFLHAPTSTYDLKDPDTAIEFGVANIRHLIDEFGTSSQGPSWDETVRLIAAGYYGGEGAAITYRDKGLEGIHDQGTHNYIRFVSTMWKERHDDKSFTYRYWYEQSNGKALVNNAEKYKK